MRLTTLALATVFNACVVSADMIGDASRFSPEAVVEVTNVSDNTCEYMLTFTYWHDPTLPMPDPNSETCDMGSIENYYELSDHVKMHTPFNHASIDWNPCGHNPEGVWDTTHYDLHLYLDPFDLEKRSQLTCNAVGNECLPAENQTTVDGLGFYDVAVNEAEKIINTPDIDPPYLWIPSSGVVSSGTHIIDTRDLGPPDEWRKPSLVMGYYGGLMAFWEPMYPVSHMEPVFFEVSGLKYVDQTIMSLPTYYSFDYDPTTGKITQVMKGPAEVCHPDIADGAEDHHHDEHSHDGEDGHHDKDEGEENVEVKNVEGDSSAAPVAGVVNTNGLTLALCSIASAVWFCMA